MQGITIKPGVTKVIYDERSWYLPTRSKYFYSDFKADGKRHKMALHRYIYEKFSGHTIRPGNDVHHLDLNNRNNDFDNLMELDATEHNRYHMEKRWGENRAQMTAGTQIGRDATKAWHASEAGRDWHREHSIKMWANRESFATRKNCEVCGASFKTYRRDAKYCSNPCSQRATYRLRQIAVTCEQCGKTSMKKDRRVRFCNPSCAMNWRNANNR
jgi:hypothetical protein